jgi:tetratricopeptide (TPR) repeat protein
MSHVNWNAILGWGPDQLRGLSFTAWSYVRQGKYEEARVIYEGLVALDPKDSHHYEMLGAVCLQLGDYQKAIEALDRGLRLKPTHQPSLVNKAKALLLLGYRDQGLAIVRPLARSDSKLIADRATALVMAYQ